MQKAIFFKQKNYASLTRGVGGYLYTHIFTRGACSGDTGPQSEVHKWKKAYSGVKVMNIFFEIEGITKLSIRIDRLVRAAAVGFFWRNSIIEYMRYTCFKKKRET
jgi:hypothetical protein